MSFKAKAIGMTLLAAGAVMSASAAKTDNTGNEPGLIPLPAQMIRTEGEFVITRHTRIISGYTPECRRTADYLNDYLGAWFGSPLEVEEVRQFVPGVLRGEYISLRIDSLMGSPDGVNRRMPAEGYALGITPRGVEITGVDRAGLFYGVQTLLQLLPPEIYQRKPSHDKIKVGCAEVRDWPRFGYRGMMLDVARTFTDAQGMRLFIDRLAYHKLNKLHWHLADDEGWRIEIKSYPELTAQGGFRGVGLPVMPYYGSWDKKYGGYFTQDEIREIVEYASLRNIEIIPEIDLPGHSRAFAQIRPGILCAGPKPDLKATAGYDRRNVWCVTKEENYAMLAEIFREVCELFPSPYIHIGGDEVGRRQWLSCPTCSRLAVKGDTGPVHDHFTSRLTGILAEYGKKPAMWNEAASSGKADKDALVYAWENIGAGVASTDKGYKTVVMPPNFFYFDMKQSPWEEGLTWGGIVDTRKNYSFDFGEAGYSARHMQHVAGVEGAFWTELLLSQGGDFLESQCYPRICSLAEVGWTQERLRNSDYFHSRLHNRHFERLGAMGIAFRVPPPDATYTDGNITAYSHMPHSGIRFTTDGKTPTRKSEAYCCATYDSGIERYLFNMYIGENRSAAVPVIISHQASLAPASESATLIPLPETPGLWYLRVRSLRSENIAIRSIEVTAPDTSYYIIRSNQKVNENHQIRYIAAGKASPGIMKITMRNDSPLPVALEYQFERSPYIEPAVKVTSTMKADPKHPFQRAADYNFSTPARTLATCRKGDMVTYTFDSPVESQSIEVVTGYRFLPRVHIPLGYVETSRDGIGFAFASDLTDGRATVHPKGPVKALRIVCTANGNGDAYVLLQDLKIVPRGNNKKNK